MTTERSTYALPATLPEKPVTPPISRRGAIEKRCKLDGWYTKRLFQSLEDSQALADLLAMLSYRRPAFSTTEKRFINRFIKPLGVETDKYGNLIKRIGDAPVLWSAHTDTVHKKSGKQTVAVFGRDVIAYTPDKASNCLGADDAAGVWMLRELIKKQVPGLYIFHRAEEIGGQGSKFIRDRTPELLKDIKYAIAFDRRGDASVITEQAIGRTCSDKFALDLALALGLGHCKDNTGTFTDTASYARLIPECTNVSVGYDNEHGPMEHLNISYLFRLRNVVLRSDVPSLVCERDPKDESNYPTYSYGGGYWPYTSSPYGTGTTKSMQNQGHLRLLPNHSATNDDELPEKNYSTLLERWKLEELVQKYPEVAYSLLVAYGASVDDFLKEAEDNGVHIQLS